MFVCSCVAAYAYVKTCLGARVAFRRPEPGTNLDLKKAATINNLPEP